MLNASELGSFSVIVLNEYRVVSALFSLKAHSESTAKQWMEQIATAQVSFASTCACTIECVVVLITYLSFSPWAFAWP